MLEEFAELHEGGETDFDLSEYADGGGEGRHVDGRVVVDGDGHRGGGAVRAAADLGVLRVVAGVVLLVLLPLRLVDDPLLLVALTLQPSVLRQCLLVLAVPVLFLLIHVDRCGRTDCQIRTVVTREDPNTRRRLIDEKVDKCILK